jgi:Arc/MetJ family transcription regulator
VYACCDDSRHIIANVKRTSMFLDRDLVHEAEAALGTKGPTETVHAAMRAAVEQERRDAAQRRLIERIKRGELAPNLTLEEFLRMRREED